MTSSYNLATSPIVNDPDYPKFYNPADGDGEPSSTWTVTSYAQAFGVSLTGTRQVTKSVSFDVKISETGEMFGQRVWNVYCPFVDNEEDWDAIEKVDDNGGDDEIMAAVGLYFVTDEMVNGGGSIEPGDITEAFVAPKAVTLQGAAQPEIYDEASGKGLIVDITKGKTNRSGLRLTYTPKKGTFKGSFKVYALEGMGKATKLKKYTVNVSGVVVGGIGYGTATCKRPAVSWPVTVR